MSAFRSVPRPRTPRVAEAEQRAYEERVRARVAWESAQEQARIDAVPGQRARLTALLLCAEERTVRARIEAATDAGERARLTERADEFRRMADQHKEEGERQMNSTKGRELRKTFREQFGALAARYKESQSDRYPEDFRQREGATILREMSLAETNLNREMLLWHRSQQIEAARLKHLDPPLDAAGETRRLREQMEVGELAEQHPTKIEAKKFLLPRAREALNAGNVDRARVFYEAAKRREAHDAALEREIEATLDRVVPHRQQAVSLAVLAADQFELARKDVAQMRVTYEIGTPQELARASTAVQMADFKRQREAVFLREESGIELPPAD